VPEHELGPRLGGHDVPALGLAERDALQLDGLGVVGVHLDRQPVPGVEELHQQREAVPGRASAEEMPVVVPDLGEGAPVVPPAHDRCWARSGCPDTPQHSPTGPSGRPR
jgi:hypothetical protein